MSVASQITRIQNLVSLLRTNIRNKGVEIANDADLETCVGKVNDISGGETPSGYEAEYLTIDNTDGTAAFDLSAYAIQSVSEQLPSNITKYTSSTGWWVEYSTDKTNWTRWNYSTLNHKITTIPTGSKLYLRSTSPTVQYKLVSSQIYTVNINLVLSNTTSSSRIKISGNPVSLVYGDDFYKQSISANSQFKYLFAENTQLSDASNLVLKATTAPYCYSFLFHSCSALTAVPSLPSLKLSTGCYAGLFTNCSSLTNVPTLPAAALANNCYQMMFYGCSSLVNAPTLSAAALAYGCYQSMFTNCTSLTTAPTLSNTELASSCYTGMFSGCTALVNAPNLPATIVPGGAYNSMFYGCTALVNPPTISATEFTNSSQNMYRMFYGCTSLTSAPTLNIAVLTLQCYDGMFKGCTSLTYVPDLPVTTVAQECYVSMFEGCTSLVTPPSIGTPTGLTAGIQYVYAEMFKGCTSLTSAPAITINIMGNYCCRSMFEGCTSLVTPPALNATSLSTYCYQTMFKNCTSLKSAPDLPATTLATYCYYQMFYGCTNLETAPTSLPATTLTSNCYYQMFYNNRKLTTAPILPATTLVTNCYYQMFYGCSVLNYIKAMFTTNPTGQTSNWVSGVQTTAGTFVKNANATWTTTGNNGVPNNWDIQYEVAA